MKKIKVFKKRSEKQIVEEINKLKNYISTQIFYIEKNWIAFVNYEEDGMLDNEKPNIDKLATKSQIWRLSKEGIKIKEDLTKQEAYQLIKELKNKSKKKNFDY